MSFHLPTPFVSVILAAAALPAPAATPTDQRIVAAAEASHVFKVYLKDDHVVVASDHGTVTLTGTVADDYHRSLAEETVRGLPGVKKVVVQLTVSPEQPADSADARLRAKVQAALLFHRGVSATNTRVLVNGGAVTLQGEADTQAQKDLTAEYVKDVDGVGRVVNEMTVAKPGTRKPLRQKVDDASITAQVKMAFLFHKATSALNTKVATSGGVVTLTGTARSQAEKDLAARIARQVDGVRSVHNRMTVDTGKGVDGRA